MRRKEKEFLDLLASYELQEPVVCITGVVLKVDAPTLIRKTEKLLRLYEERRNACGREV